MQHSRAGLLDIRQLAPHGVREIQVPAIIESRTALQSLAPLAHCRVGASSSTVQLRAAASRMRLG